MEPFTLVVPLGTQFPAGINEISRFTQICNKTDKCQVTAEISALTEHPWMLQSLSNVGYEAVEICKLVLQHEPKMHQLYSMFHHQDGDVRRAAGEQFVRRINEANFICLSLALWHSYQHDVACHAIIDAILSKSTDEKGVVEAYCQALRLPFAEGRDRRLEIWKRVSTLPVEQISQILRFLDPEKNGIVVPEEITAKTA